MANSKNRFPEKMRLSGKKLGLTLVEILVVILIISALFGLILPGLRYVRRKADKHFTKQEINRLSLAIENFAEEDPLGDWPPVKLSQLGIPSHNELNEPTECLVLCLSTQRGEGPYFQFDYERLKNLDGDSEDPELLRKKIKTIFEGGELLEYVDLWGNPYIYMPYYAYGKEFKYMNAEGKTFSVRLQKDPRLGAYPQPLKFVIWSCGPDGTNQNGEGDDICSWK